MVAYALLAMTVPMVQSCSDDDEQEDKIPTTADEILEYIQGDWVVEYTVEDPAPSYIKLVHAEHLMLKKRDGKLLFEGLAPMDDEDMAPNPGPHPVPVPQPVAGPVAGPHLPVPLADFVISITESGVMTYTVGDKVTLPSYSLPCVHHMLTGFWNVTKSVKANGDLMAKYLYPEDSGLAKSHVIG